MTSLRHHALPIIAAFDFDGTMTDHDTLLPFIIYTHGPLWTVLKMIPLLPLFVIHLGRKDYRQFMKEKVLARFFGGRSIEEIRDLGAVFVRDRLVNLVKPNALACLRWHQARKHRCILVSASVDVYLEGWARSVGFHDVLTSRLQLSQDGAVTGQLVGHNCWGPEKVRRLAEIMGARTGYKMYAYGDARGDRELLEMADYPFYREFPIPITEDE